MTEKEVADQKIIAEYKRAASGLIKAMSELKKISAEQDHVLKRLPPEARAVIEKIKRKAGKAKNPEDILKLHSEVPKMVKEATEKANDNSGNE